MPSGSAEQLRLDQRHAQHGPTGHGFGGHPRTDSAGTSQTANISIAVAAAPTPAGAAAAARPGAGSAVHQFERLRQRCERSLRAAWCDVNTSYAYIFCSGR
jgi:hypothetical protein